MILPSRYRNYWLDLVRKEDADKKEIDRKKAISSIVSILQGMCRKKKKP
jgi:hypothetical protein